LPFSTLCHTFCLAKFSQPNAQSCERLRKEPA
jgi:hypothetical protein